MAYFPASGYRSCDAGFFAGISIGGYSWSSSTNGVGDFNVGFLGFSEVNYFQPLRRDARPYALPVRCVQELALAFCVIVKKYYFKPGVL